MIYFKYFRDNFYSLKGPLRCFLLDFRLVDWGFHVETCGSLQKRDMYGFYFDKFTLKLDILFLRLELWEELFWKRWCYNNICSRWRALDEIPQLAQRFGGTSPVVWGHPREGVCSIGLFKCEGHIGWLVGWRGVYGSWIEDVVWSVRIYVFKYVRCSSLDV